MKVFVIKFCSVRNLCQSPFLYSDKHCFELRESDGFVVYSIGNLATTDRQNNCSFGLFLSFQ